MEFKRMEKKPTKTIIKVGNSVGIILDKFMLHDSNLLTGDKLEYKCSNGKIIFKKCKE